MAVLSTPPWSGLLLGILYVTIAKSKIPLVSNSWHFTKSHLHLLLDYLVWTKDMLDWLPRILYYKFAMTYDSMYLNYVIYMDHRLQGFLAVVWFGSFHLSPPLSRQQVFFLSQFCVSPVELTDGTHKGSEKAWFSIIQSLLSDFWEEQSTYRYRLNASVRWRHMGRCCFVALPMAVTFHLKNTICGLHRQINTRMLVLMTYLRCNYERLTVA